MVFLPLVLLLAAQPQATPRLPRPVVVELFTSEGCSSCPPADEVLQRLEAQPLPGVQIIPLGFHVDYWNHLGWRDRYSEAAFTSRQMAYARVLHQDSVYTPEMVVDGRKGFVGSGGAEAVAAIREASKEPSLPLELKREVGGLALHLPDPAGLKGAQLWLVITEDSLSSDVLRGENGGRRLHHAAVVRRLQFLGSAAGDRWLTLDLPSSWRLGQLHAVVFAQDPRTLRVLGAATIPLG